MDNFKPMFWSKFCQTELAKDLVLANWCDYKFEGELKEGSRLKIVGAVRPTIQKYVPGTPLDIETLGDNSQYLDITESDAFAFRVDDIERVQKKEGYLETQFSEAKKALAETADVFVGAVAANANSDMMSVSTDISAASSPLDIINVGIQKLYENNVSKNEELAADLNPQHTVLIMDKFASLFTNNVDFIKKGALGKYFNTYLRMSNNLHNDGINDLEMLRTKKAIAFAGQIDKIEVNRDPYGFGDIIKGLHVYGAKLVRPKELYVMKVK